MLLQSHPFEAPREAGQAIAALRRGEVALAQAPCSLGEGVTAEAVQAALATLAAADAEKAAAKAVQA